MIVQEVYAWLMYMSIVSNKQNIKILKKKYILFFILIYIILHKDAHTGLHFSFQNYRHYIFTSPYEDLHRLIIIYSKPSWLLFSLFRFYETEMLKGWTTNQSAYEAVEALFIMCPQTTPEPVKRLTRAALQKSILMESGLLNAGYYDIWMAPVWLKSFGRIQFVIL